ncbi:hypothetical protein H310_08367 [Aphanomyces invadans]|uniref:Potassium channel domain-containing protein n=1 Tax=Aphanomyces invadans TaxID=157072 RepID=A0A024TZV4_9STRA|nr:hypothetical protein H310_08367 [Aphanomyces invadans]ETV98872.1 hypothetical protein H310_08367 [Aphanomyces invadans]|eukprot:XP_008872300.1 hypothetical protein H310_08367 [Aphanomyces invadans]
MDPSVEMSPTTSKHKGKLGGTASPVVSGSEKYMKQLQSPSVRKLFSENQTVQNLQVIHNLKKNYRHRKLFEIWAFVVAIVGLVLMLAENEVLMVADASSTPLSEALKTVVSISTAILLILIVCRYQSHTNIYKLQNIIPPTASMLSVFWPVLLLELIVCGFHIPPYLSGSLPILQFRHSLDSNENAICRHPKNLTTTIHDNACYLSYSYNYDVFGVFMVLRLYLFGRYMRSSSPLYSQWAAFIGTLKNVNAMSPFFHFKAIFSTQPARLVAPLLVFVTFVTAAIIRILEVPAQPVLLNYWTAVWMTTASITSVGYGDYAPVTYAGRGFLTCSGILGGLLILSLVQSIFFGALELTDNESRVKYIIDKTRWDKQRREAAVKLIQTQYRLKRQLHPRNGPVNQRAVDNLSLHLFECMEAMHKFVRGEPRNARTFEEEMDGHIGSLLRAMDDMKRDEDAILQRIQDKTRRLHAACDDILASTM